MYSSRNPLFLAPVAALLLYPGNFSVCAGSKPQAAQSSQSAGQNGNTTSKSKEKASGDSSADSSTVKKPLKSKKADTGDASPATSAPAHAAPATVPTTKPATPAAPAPTKATTAQQPPPADSNGMVWVNTDSGVYHKPGSRYYGKTKQGKYMTEADAIKAGYRASAKK